MPPPPPAPPSALIVSLTSSPPPRRFEASQFNFSFKFVADSPPGLPLYISVAAPLTQSLSPILFFFTPSFSFPGLNVRPVVLELFSASASDTLGFLLPDRNVSSTRDRVSNVSLSPHKHRARFVPVGSSPDLDWVVYRFTYYYSMADGSPAPTALAAALFNELFKHRSTFSSSIRPSKPKLLVVLCY